jgi:hypothetical protein
LPWIAMTPIFNDIASIINAVRLKLFYCGKPVTTKNNL